MSPTKKDKAEIMELINANREEIERGIEEVLSRYDGCSVRCLLKATS